MTNSPAALPAADLAEDVDAVLMARELVQRFELLKALAEHPAVNRAQIAVHRAEASRVLDALKGHLLVVDFGA